MSAGRPQSQITTGLAQLDEKLTETDGNLGQPGQNIARTPFHPMLSGQAAAEEPCQVRGGAGHRHLDAAWTVCFV